MISREALDALGSELGADAVEQHEPVDLDGAKLAVSLRPADGPALAAALALLRRAGLAVIVRGGGARLDLGNTPARADVFVDTVRLTGVDDFDPGEGVCHAGAGTPLSELRAVVEPRGWELPLDPPGEASTLGGTLATAAVGPRALGYGRPRDLVLGLEVAHPSGDRTRCGGRVVKNVTGYDMNKIYTGSLGTLGVIEGAWLRLRPRPERVVALEARFGSLAAACEAALAAARGACARACTLLPDENGGLRAIVELAGDAAGVERDAERLARGVGAVAAADDAIDTVRRAQGALPSPCGLRFRISALPSAQPDTLARLRDAGARILAQPGSNLLYAGYALSDPDDADAAEAVFAGVARAAREAGGGWVCESAPASVKRGRDVFGDVSAVQPLIRALKQRFDPDGVLNPGRFAGRT
jgi:glycolate oxidase FAD binding subunit